MVIALHLPLVNHNPKPIDRFEFEEEEEDEDYEDECAAIVANKEANLDGRHDDAELEEGVDEELEEEEEVEVEEEEEGEDDSYDYDDEEEEDNDGDEKYAAVVTMKEINPDPKEEAKKAFERKWGPIFAMQPIKTW